MSLFSMSPTHDFDGAERFSAADPRVRFMEPVLSYGEMRQLLTPTEQTFPPERLIAMLASCSWEQTYLMLARVGALLANSPDGGHGQEIRARTTDLLASTLASNDPEERVVAFYVRVNAPRIIAHEEIVYFLQALAILYGRDDGLAPTDAQLAFWMLAGNDHCFGWRQEGGEVSVMGEIVASSARSLLFNRQHDTLPLLVRSAAMLDRPPPRTAEWKSVEAWTQFKTRAFGLSFDEHIDFLAGALYVMSVGWGVAEEGGLRNPTLSPEEWIAGTGVPRPHALLFFERASASRSELQNLLRAFVGGDGLPRGSSIFYVKPFARFESGILVAASPWAVREQIRGAVWASLLAQAKSEHGDSGGADRWLAAFGDLFEVWCRDVARMAASSAKFRGTLVMSESVGDSDEVEDVVVVDDGNVLFVSAKARTIRQELLKGALSSAKVLAWYESFLFGKRTGDQRGGAIRLLDQKITHVRAGRYAARGVRVDSKIFPMLVTYDHLGADNPGFYVWLSDRCKAENLLQQAGVLQLVTLNVEKFESLRGFGAAGGDIFGVLERRGPEERADVALFDAGTDIESTRLPELEQRFQTIMDRLLTRLGDAKRASAVGSTPE